MTEPEAAQRAPGADLDRSPVHVDLDGTLIASDSLWDSICQLVRESPRLIVRLPLWLAGGKARFKARVAERVVIDPTLLPYRPEVLEYLEAARRAGRPIVLATASDRRVARQVADHLGLFDEVLASDGVVNLSGPRKLDRIREHTRSLGRPEDDFEYVGNGSADVAVWNHAAVVTMVAPTRGARRRTRGLPHRQEIRVPIPSPLRTALRAMRSRQWAKNLLLFVPLVLAHQALDMARVANVLIAFAAFSVVASAGYLINDLLDLPSDRRHPRKARRAVAAGELSVPGALALAATLLVVGGTASMLLLRPAWSAILASYLVLSLSYTLYLKRRLLLDVLMLASLYGQRIFAGAVAAEVIISPWLLAFSMFFFLSLGLVKRYVELRGVLARGQQLPGRAYEEGDAALVETMGMTSGWIAVLVLCLFFTHDDVTQLYRTPELLWVLAPLMLYWIGRVWFLAHRGQFDDDPVLFATTDAISYMIGALAAAVLVAASL